MVAHPCAPERDSAYHDRALTNQQRQQSLYSRQTNGNVTYSRAAFRLISACKAQTCRQTNHIHFAGLKTGPVSWLLEFDRFEDDPETGLTDEIDVAFLEANWQIARGHNLKLTAEQIDSDLEPDEQQRYSAVYEYTPFPFVQLRLGYRDRESDANNALLNANQAFLELHSFF